MPDTKPENPPAKFSYSWDEENYHGEFASKADAIAEAFAERPDADVVYVGENDPPTPPENFIDEDDIIEIVATQDDYSSEWADHWPGHSKEQRNELTDAIREVFGKWLDKHSLRPTFFIVRDAERIERNGGAS